MRNEFLGDYYIEVTMCMQVHRTVGGLNNDDDTNRLEMSQQNISRPLLSYFYVLACFDFGC